MRTPTPVIHGDVDPLVRLEAGRDTAAAIPGARLVVVSGMGHAPPIPLWPQIIEAVADHSGAHSWRGLRSGSTGPEFAPDGVFIDTIARGRRAPRRA